MPAEPRHSRSAGAGCRTVRRRRAEPPAALALNQSLRNDLGAPDQHYLIVVSAGEREAALLAAEQIASRLPALVDLGVITGFETPTRFLPSVATQRARQAALPGRTELRSEEHT